MPAGVTKYGPIGRVTYYGINDNGNKESDNGARFSYAGGNANTADRDNQQKARDMMADNESIRQQTGWFKGADGVWRFEIDDSKAVVSAIG